MSPSPTTGHQQTKAEYVMMMFFDRKFSVASSIMASFAIAAFASDALAWSSHPAAGGGGCATSIAAGDAAGPNSGTVWITGCTRYPSGGFDVWSSTNGGAWTMRTDPPQQAKDIAADSTGDLAAIGGNGDTYFGYVSGSSVVWTEAGACGTSIAT